MFIVFSSQLITCTENFKILSTPPTPAVTSSSSSIQTATGVNNPQFTGSHDTHDQLVQHAANVSLGEPVAPGVSRAIQIPPVVSSSVGPVITAESLQGMCVYLCSIIV